MTGSRTLSAALDAAERSGRLNVRTEELRVALPGVGPEALRQALHRQQRRGRLVRLSRGSGHWLIVPLQHAAAGAPPLETWLDRYLSKTLAIPYYVALLSAAETYGASPYAVLVTQVMVPERRRPLTVGRHRVEFHTRSRIDRAPTRWHETADGRFRVATPELTALELVERSRRAGGMARVREVLRELCGFCTVRGLTAALDALEDVPNAQRLGALLALDGHDELAARVARWLRGRPLRLVSIEPGEAPRAASRIDATFKVRLPGRAPGAAPGANA
jgi:predicted transcriptional regulator of viral defense system